MTEKVYLCSFKTVFGTMEKKHEELRRLVEQVLGMEVKTPSDFELLQNQIGEKIGERLSLSTLKRFWGYVDKDNTDYRVRVTTLDILSQFAGYQSWVAFCQADLAASDESGTSVSRHLYVKELALGTHIVLKWNPDRVVTLRYEGEDLLTVVESINSKLRSGDTCHCTHIVEGMALTLFLLVREGTLMGNYVCGKTHGVAFAVRS